MTFAYLWVAGGEEGQGCSVEGGKQVIKDVIFVNKLLFRT